MSENPTTVEPDTTVDEAARIIHDTGHNRLPVVEHGRLVGVVTRVDVLGGARLGLADMPTRALARVTTGAIEAQLPAPAPAGTATQLCAVVKADGYGHGATRARAAPGRRTRLAGRGHRRRGGRAARRRDRRADPGDGRADRSDATGVDADADVVVWTASSWRDRARRRPRVHVKLDTGMGRLGTKDPDEALAIVRRGGRRRATSSWPA